jgi:succinate dehydrogenase flavin-adding protein (antitoxin of CptAB toxin-antitoxin module)
MKHKEKLPKWFTQGGGVLYEKGNVIHLRNESVELDNLEMSMYDFILGCEDNEMTNLSSYKKAIDWFKNKNNEIYIKLIK